MSKGGGGKARPTVCLWMDGWMNGRMDGEPERERKEERHFHQDYPAAENLIWESGPVLTEHTHTASGGCKTGKAVLHLCLPRKSPL